MAVKKYEYTEEENYTIERLLGFKKKLMIDQDSFQQALNLTRSHIQAIDRCRDAWLAEVLFRRGVPIASQGLIDFNDSGFEVDDDQPT